MNDQFRKTPCYDHYASWLPQDHDVKEKGIEDMEKHNKQIARYDGHVEKGQRLYAHIPEGMTGKKGYI